MRTIFLNDDLTGTPLTGRSYEGSLEEVVEILKTAGYVLRGIETFALFEDVDNEPLVTAALYLEHQNGREHAILFPDPTHTTKYEFRYCPHLE